MPEHKNQCTGCQEGLHKKGVVNPDGKFAMAHFKEDDGWEIIHSYCTKDRYVPTDQKVDTICSLRHGSMDDKQFRDTVEHNLNLAVSEAVKKEQAWFIELIEKSDFIGMTFQDKKHTDILNDLIQPFKKHLITLIRSREQ